MTLQTVQTPITGNVQARMAALQPAVPKPNHFHLDVWLMVITQMKAWTGTVTLARDLTIASKSSAPVRIVMTVLIAAAAIPIALPGPEGNVTKGRFPLQFVNLRSNIY